MTTVREPPAHTAMLRVTVCSATRRVDLAVPGALPVADLLPELARGVGLLDGATAHLGYQVCRIDGRVLEQETGLLGQGVGEGDVLVLEHADAALSPTYDDKAEAVAEAVAHVVRSWTPTATRRAAQAIAATWLLLGGLVVPFGHASVRTVGGLAAVAVLLLVTAILADRHLGDAATAVMVAWIGAGHAGLAGFCAIAGSAQGIALLAQPLAAGGAAMAGAGFIGMLGRSTDRALMLPTVMLGMALGGAGGLIAVGPLPPAEALAGLMAAAVLVGSAFPMIAFGVTTTKADRLTTRADITTPPQPIDLGQIAIDVRLAHHVVLALTSVAGALVVLCAPFAVSRGVAGTVLALGCCVLVASRTRHYRAASLVAVGVGSGALGLVAVTVAAVLLHPTWRVSVAAAAITAGAAVLVAAMGSLGGSPMARRLGELAEAACMLALPPLAVVATGVLSLVGG